MRIILKLIDVVLLRIPERNAVKSVDFIVVLNDTQRDGYSIEMFPLNG